MIIPDYSQGAIKVKGGKGVIHYLPGPIATAAHRSTARVKLAWGPLGTAKTSWLCWRLFAIGQRAAAHGLSMRAILARDTYRNLVDSTLQTFLYWFPEGVLSVKEHSDPVDIKLWTPLKTDPNKGMWHTILFRHGQTEQDASMFLSTEYDFIGLEEIAPAYLPGQGRISPGISEGVFDMALPRLTRAAERAAIIRPEMAMTCNSPPTNHWASVRIIDKHPSYLESLNWAHWMFDQADNAANLAPDYYSSLEKAWEGKLPLIRRFIKGERIPVFIGIPRFNLDHLDKVRAKCIPPKFKGTLTATDENPLGLRLDARDDGSWAIWQAPKLGKKYVMGVDVSEGLEGGDYSAAVILDAMDCSICAIFHGKIEPEKLGREELKKGGELYNNAKIIIETYPSAHGATALLALKNAGYQEIYYHQALDARQARRPRMGYPMSESTKTIIVDGIGDYLAEGGEPCDKELVTELMTFGVDENGRCNAQQGCHDDLVIAYGLALYLIKFAGITKFFPHAKKMLGEQLQADQDGSEN